VLLSSSGHAPRTSTPLDRELATDALLHGYIRDDLGATIKAGVRKLYIDAGIPEERAEANVGSLLGTPAGRQSAIAAHKTSAPTDFIELKGRAADEQLERKHRVWEATSQVTEARRRLDKNQKAVALGLRIVEETKASLDHWKQRDLQAIRRNPH